MPGEVDERVHRVGFAARGSAALRTDDMLETGMAMGRVAGLIERNIFRKQHWQIG